MEEIRAQAQVDELKRQFELVDDAHLAKVFISFSFLLTFSFPIL